MTNEQPQQLTPASPPRHGRPFTPVQLTLLARAKARRRRAAARAHRL